LAVVERRAAMAATRIDQAWPALSVAEQDQLLSQDLHRPWCRTGVAAEPDRMPVAAQQFPHRRAATDFRELAVVAGRFQRISGRHHSTLAPDCLTSSAQIGVSRASTLASSAGVEP